jgi:hypothetical protein
MAYKTSFQGFTSRCKVQEEVVASKLTICSRLTSVHDRGGPNRSKSLDLVTKIVFASDAKLNRIVVRCRMSNSSGTMYSRTHDITKNKSASIFLQL